MTRRKLTVDQSGGNEPTTTEFDVVGESPDVLDDVLTVSDRAAHAEVQRLAAEEGHLVGSSSGAASVAARDIADRIAAGDLDVPARTVVTVFPDGSERYLSKHIYGSFDAWEGKA